MFPVYMKKEGTTPPETVPHYIIAKNGTFLKKGNWWMEAVVPVKQIAVLEEQSVKLTLKIQPITALVLMKAWRFFQAIYEKHHSESAVLLHYSEKLGWELTVPQQSATFAHVDYKMTDRVPGYSFIGTMHSHSSMSAFHSGTDVGDEAQVDGIHITFGDLDEKERFSLDPEIVVNGTRFMLPLGHMEGVTRVVEEGTDPTSPYYAYSIVRHPRYTVICPELKEWKTPNEWIAKVENKTVFVRTVPVNGHTFDWQRMVVDKTPSMADENPAAGSAEKAERKKEATS